MVDFVGADGCKTGWISFGETSDGNVIVMHFASFADLIDECIEAKIIAVDVPIGLDHMAKRGGRLCDQEARRLLGQPRGSSVFPPPVRQALDARSFDDAKEINMASSIHRIGITRQAFGIFPKLKEVDEMMTPDFQRKVKEVHPELCFYEMNGCSPVVASKKRREGKECRRQLLSIAFPYPLDDLILKAKSISGVQEDDVLDALAALWSAKRIQDGTAIRIPADPVIDSSGLSMEIWR